MRQRAAASLLYQSQYAEPAFRNLLNLIFLKIVGRILAFYNPRTGTGQVEQLKGYDGSVYSRRITKEHRLIYKIYDEVVEVLVLSTFGHYK